MLLFTLQNFLPLTIKILTGPSIFELSDSDSAQSLVENAALEIVTVLLGIEKPKSRPSSGLSSKSISSE